MSEHHTLPDTAPAQTAFGDALRAVERTEEAVAAYRRAIMLDNTAAPGWYGLGEALAMLGDVEEAIASLRRAVSLDPHLLAGWIALAKAGDRASAPALASVLGQPGRPGQDRIAAGFALAGLLDRAGSWDAAFAAVEQANALKREQLAREGRRFDPQALQDYVAQQIARAPMRAAGDPSEQPVFVVGMPRSGTTLVEQILASHSGVRALGESNAIGGLDAALSADPSALPELVRRHVASFGSDVARVVDKTPDNLFHLGLIAALFPNARVIFCQRDPRDICLSCYFQDFAEPMPYAYDLAACAARVRAVEQLAAHWQRTLTLRMHVVQYETLIADVEGESRRLLAFLGLGWETRCLDFHRTRRAVRTASLWQVREPLYTRSVRRWQHYVPHIGVLLEAFGSE